MQLLSGLLVLEDCSDKYRNNDDDGNDDFGCLLRMALPAVLRRESSAGIDLHDCRRIGPPRLLSIIIMTMIIIIIIIIIIITMMIIMSSTGDDFHKFQRTGPPRQNLNTENYHFPNI